MSLRPKVEAAAQLLHEIAVEAAGEGEQPLTVRAVLMAAELRGWLEGKRLTDRKYLPKLGKNMNDAQREAISKGRTNTAMARAARTAGFKTLGALAGALKAAGYPVGISFLSQVANKAKPMPPDLAAALTKLIGWP